MTKHPAAPRLCLIVLALASCPCEAQDIDGFLEPYRSIDVPALEMGSVKAVNVTEGDQVDKGQALAVLDREIHQQLLRIAKQAMDSVGRVESAKAELALNEARLEKLLRLRSKGFARQEEVERTRADVAVARGDVLTAEEDAAIKQLEYEKARIHLERRTVTAPVAGVISIIHKEVGEFVSQNDPYVMQIVQLDRLRINFSVPAESAAELCKGQRVEVRIGHRSQTAPAIVEFVSPITDAESGTVRVKVQINNQAREFRSGDRGSLIIRNTTVASSANHRSGSRP